MDLINHHIKTALANRKTVHKLRSLSGEIEGVDFCSNDYLGLSKSPTLHQQWQRYLATEEQLGSSGSRLISGDRQDWQRIEQDIADFHGEEACLVFGSGYQANLGVLSAIPRRGDTIIYDQLIHASLRDGIRLSLAKAYSFRHNDLVHLEERLAHGQGQVFIVVESLYSMDGDTADLTAINGLCGKYGAVLIVDEAHALGIFGKEGRGLVHEVALEGKIFARIVTFGKALGAHGAAVLTSRQTCDYLINFARPFIYTTGPSPHHWWHLKVAYPQMAQAEEERKKLFALINEFHRLWPKDWQSKLLLGPGPIQGVVVGDNEKALNLANVCKEAGLALKAILHPTVPKGKERLRICLHAFNTERELNCLVETIISAW